MVIPPIVRASWIGLTATAPCPIPTEMTSPAYHFCRKVFIFHSSDGMVPLTSFGRSIPVFLLSPIAVAHLAIFSMPSRSASV